MAWIVKTESYSAWDAGARTIASFNNDGAFTFMVGQSTGIVCGLNSEDLSANNVEIDYGFFIEETKARIVEQGVSKTLPATFSKAHTFKIERLRGVVTYYINDVLIYTSLTESTGNVFGDCSLYSRYDDVLAAEIIDYSVTGGGVAELAATFPALTAKADEFDQVLLGTFPALSAIGSEFDQVLLTTFPAITVEGVVDSGERLAGSFPALIGFGATDEINFVRGAFPALTASGSDLAELVPEYNALNAELPRLLAGGYEFIDENNHIEATYPALKALGVETELSYGYAVLAPVAAFGYLGYSNYFGFSLPNFNIDFSHLVSNAAVYLDIPAPVLTATANDYDNIRLTSTIPAPVLTAFTGAVASLSIPSPVLASTGTVQVFALAELEIPAPLLTASALVGSAAQVTVDLPAPTLTASTGAYASLAVLAPELTAMGSVGHLAQVALTLPFLELTATARTGGLATVSLSIPEPTLVASGLVGAMAQVVLVLPAVVLQSSGSYVAPTASLPVYPPPNTVYVHDLVAGTTTVQEATESTYAINLTTGAVTTLLLGEITRLVTAHGRLYGLRGTELVRLDGDTDDTALIPATVRFAPQTFGSNRAKRLSTVYIEARENDGLTVDVIADETQAWRYQTVTDTARGYGTHKVKVGRGVKFHTAGLVIQNRNGGKMDIGGMELLVDTGAPRPRS